MQYGEKSEGLTARLLTTMKLPNQWRTKVASAATPGRSSCCTPAEISQSQPRWPKPWMTSSAYRVTMLGFPKFVGLRAPHSPLATGLARSQSGTKSRLMSPHVRVAVFTDVFTGLFRLANPVASAATYRLMLALTAVLPFPNRSHEPPIRGERSFQFGTS